MQALSGPPSVHPEDEEAEAAAEAGQELTANGSMANDPSTADKEVAAWVQGCLERKAQGKMTFAKKPALHEAPLDAVPGSPAANKGEGLTNLATDEAHEIRPNPGIRVNSPELVSARVESVDFASNVDRETE